jgi:ribA/ribD-fused uncharacterized protein
MWNCLKKTQNCEYNKCDLRYIIHNSCKYQFINIEIGNDRIYNIKYPCIITDAVYGSFISVYHYILYRKAFTFLGKEHSTTKYIKNITCHLELKRDMIKISNYDISVWMSMIYNVFAEGNYMKFDQNLKLQEHLLKYSGKLLAIVGNDPIWNTGMSLNGSLRTPVTKWVGKNLLGKILTSVCDLVYKELLYNRYNTVPIIIYSKIDKLLLKTYSEGNIIKTH